MLSETIFYNSESSKIGRIKTEAVEPNKQTEKNFRDTVCWILVTFKE